MHKFNSNIPQISSLWKLKNFNPNDSQKEAILHTDGPLFLSAGPGSGKTRVLLWRTLNLIVYHNIKPEEIFLSTFTEKAAFQLKDGLIGLLGLASNYTNQSYDLAKMAIGTVHSICNRIVTDRRFTDGRRVPPPVLMDDLKQYFYIYHRDYWGELVKAGNFQDEETCNKEINNYLFGFESSSRHNAVSNIISIFNRFSEECLDPKEIKTGDLLLEKILKMYEFYLNSLYGKVRTVDFSLLQQCALETIKKSVNASNVFKHVIIDEYQDTNHIQEKLFFNLCKGSKNICIVGDDDQSLYRFRGATVENLVQFEDRCKKHLGIKPKKIDLIQNYRSRKRIVDTYSSFMNKIDWKKEKPQKGHYRIIKNIKAINQDAKPSVITSSHSDSEVVYSEIAILVKTLKNSGKVEDYNQIAFLFPTIKSGVRVKGFKEALEALNIPVYAPRAGRFLEVEEAMAIWGLFIKIFGKPSYSFGLSGGLKEYIIWLRKCRDYADSIIADDPQLKLYIEDKKEEISIVLSDYELLTGVLKRKKWNHDDVFKLEMLRDLLKPANLSDKAKRILNSNFLNNAIELRKKQNNPFKIRNIINRVTSMDWSILDLFYQLNAFDYFRQMYALAENGTDEGPICNLGLITQYLARYMEEVSPIITGSFLSEDKFVNSFFASYTYALFRRGESEYEDSDDPFPKGRVPFLTIHQAKGLEFPVVVLGSLFKRSRGPRINEIIMKGLLNKESEPVDKMSNFDDMRMFYVALSRAKNLLILPQYKGSASAIGPFKELFQENNFTLIDDFNTSTLPKAVLEGEDFGKSYSYTGDYLNYNKCPRNYMIFNKYGFVPSRSQTMFFGSLVHQTIEDLHNLLIQEKKGSMA